MKGYVSIDEMITIAESKIKGSIFEVLGTEKFLQRALDNAEIEPVFYFLGYGVLQAFVGNKFYSENENIQNMWRFGGYFRDNHSMKFFCFGLPKEKLKSSFRNLGNDRFILRFNSGDIIDLNYCEYIGSHTKEALNDIDDEGEVTILDKGASLFNKKPVYKGTFGHEDIKDTIIIDRDDVYISINELSEVLNLEPSAYDLTFTNPEPKTDVCHQHIAELESEIADLKNQLSQAKAELVGKPTDDLKDVPHQSYRTVARVMYAMAQLAKEDNSKPFSQNKPSLNASITTILQNDGVPLESEAVGKWLSRINDIKPLK